MGVLGLTPFLQKTCPEVIKYLPDRLHALSGKRIVIDGTLITQRFHFAPMPQRYRHVLSWYRLARHMRDSNIQAVCVFDGGKRSFAKERELERRRRDRMMTAARGAFEVDRLSRLRRLGSSLRAWSQIQPGTAEELTALKPLTNNSKLHLAFAPFALLGIWKELLFKRSASRTPGIPLTYDSSGELESQPASEERTDLPIDVDHLQSVQAALDLETEKTPEKLARKISQLHEEFHKSIPHLISLSDGPPSNEALQDGFVPASTEDDAEAAQKEYALSKSQHKLMMEEGKLWQQLAGHLKLDGVAESVAELADVLEAKSSVLTESYLRRTHPPTRETYDESREVLHAMGIPCIEPEGAYEGEALAASLVVNGYADYVASEDTDVLIYDAPLIRNLASRQGPLVLISGSEVRTVLELDRARFVDFALLLGTDFSQRIKNVGPARALKFIREHGSIERVLEHETQYPPRIPVSEYLEQVELARMVFQTLPPTPDNILLQQGEIDEEEVAEVLDRYGLRRYAFDDGDSSHTLSGNYFADDPAAA